MEHWQNRSLENIVEYTDDEIGWVTEEWKDIKGYKGLYKISNFGRVKSYIKAFRSKKERIRIRKLVIEKKGYLSIVLRKMGVPKSFKVHRLVASHFIKNAKHKPEVNHKKGNKKDNRVHQLEWNTSSENSYHAFRIGLKNNKGNKHPMFGKKGRLHAGSKKVNQYDTNGVLIKQWDSMRDVERELNIFSQNISSVCRGVKDTAGGFVWRFAI